jgi:hypothetical protein
MRHQVSESPTNRVLQKIFAGSGTKPVAAASAVVAARSEKQLDGKRDRAGRGRTAY